MKRSFALLLLAAIPGLASAADWYVDAGGGGDGTVSRPFASVHEATDVAAPGDRILLAPGTYRQTRTILVNGRQRRALVVPPAGVEIVGAGRALTILDAPAGEGPPIFGITASGIGRGTIVRDLRITGPCFQGINLREASPTLLRIDVLTDVTGSSSTAVDVRDGSDPFCGDMLIDGGHSALFVEFGSSGRYEDCVVGKRPNEALAFSDADPVLVRCEFLGAGRDLLVLNQGSQPELSGCTFGRGDRWTVRVAGGYPGPVIVDLGGNRWFSTDPDTLAAAILDATDDAALRATVEFEPVLGGVRVGADSMSGLKSRWSAGPD